MGNNPSKPPSGASPTTTGSHGYPASSLDKKVNRRVSIQALSGAKATAADPSPSKESATGQAVSHNHQQGIQQSLQSRNIGERNVDRSDRRPRRTAPDEHTGSPYRRDDVYSLAEHTEPVKVPSNSNSDRSANQRHPYVAPSAPPLNTWYGAPHLQRPPRLPLPIGDATATPGSPIIPPGDSLIVSLSADEADAEIARQASKLSNTTIDDDEPQDELQPYGAGSTSKTVPTLVEWIGLGEKVYVTGTFVNWERKFKLHRGEDDIMRITLQLRPGTHHLKFIVDAEMRTSDNLPTAVDFTNHLVNYIEVSADEIVGSRRGSDRMNKSGVPSGIYPPQVIPETLHDESSGAVEDDEDKEEPEEEIPMADTRAIIPQFLVEIENEEESSTYQRAANVIGDAPTPPSLPLFLARPILNGTTPMKDDNSVLNYPNHTVLNHLATSSIKNGVLATSVTTRYKRKYVTTILYKATGDITD